MAASRLGQMDGVVDSQNYVYTKQYVNVSNEKWILIEQEIEIATDGTYSIVIMNAKKPGAAVLIDDFTFSLGSCGFEIRRQKRLDHFNADL